MLCIIKTEANTQHAQLYVFSLNSILISCGCFKNAVKTHFDLTEKLVKIF